MKKVFLILTGMAAVACTGNKQPEVIAHRGFWQAATVVPHNSIAALENSIALGCFGTEFDIWLTADDVPVVFHDGHTANGVTIAEATYDSLITTDGVLANGEKIPTLDEFLTVWDRSDKKVKLIFEIKSHGTPERDREAAAKVHGTAVVHGITPEQMEYIAFSRDVCKALTGITSEIPVAYLSGDLAPADAISELGVTGIDYNGGVLKKHPEWIAAAQELGLTVNVWTIDDEADMRHFIDAGVDYITTDRPDVLTEILSALK